MSRFAEYNESFRTEEPVDLFIMYRSIQNACDIKVVERHGLDMSKHFQLFSIIKKNMT
jgi:hypothetical protein